MAELLIGCGNSRERQMLPLNKPDWTALTTLDLDPNCKPDVEWDLEVGPLPFDDESFDEIHAYHVLEHTGRQGDFRFFFAQFADFWRLLKPEGVFCGMVPGEGSHWLWGDPGHRRVISPAMMTFLDQDEYTRQVGRTSLADYRRWYRADLRMVWSDVKPDAAGQPVFFFVLQAVKPSRISL